MDNAKGSPLYRKENCRVVIGSETVFIDCPERFAWLLEEKLGEEVADYFRGTVEELTFDPANATAPIKCRSIMNV